MPDKKILWIMLSIFVCFDNIFSYIAVTVFNLREGYPLGAYLIHNISPLFYFLFAPLSLSGMYGLVKFSGWLCVKTEKDPRAETRDVAEKITLASIVIAWGIGVTSANLFVLINGMAPILAGNIWRYWMLAGVILGIAYALFQSHKANKNI